jgi:ADP-ribose pyrophosphatase YjhB (NUDIX family)
LLAKRDQEPGRGQWSLPGGVVELGETLIDALKREIYEEVSMKIEVGGLVRLLDRILYDQERRVRFHYVIADYWGWVVSGQPAPATDVSEACFVPLNRVQKMEIHKDVKETTLMAFKMRQAII